MAEDFDALSTHVAVGTHNGERQWLVVAFGFVLERSHPVNLSFPALGGVCLYRARGECGESRVASILLTAV